ncbi:glycosyltransferase family 4 protein [Bdellovibrio svalbardensis]|uniref:Glycosyltransferase family 4 protein n=1 Tax=Bdellovibrio svalbardensis TaxID=2972972 RepID=A0ABT6DIW5_9BACT|nr:glycosyltransferase family 4 protein [Bdellovibrio svalbardensis]MDG0816711.1 glycosyltransferase family 4 protein [Bdellovibrio svalbardensis]
MGEVRVLHCIHSLSWGGLEIYTCELIQKLASTGIKQVVLCSAHSRVAEELKKAHIEILPFPEKKLSKLATARIIRRIITKHKITLLHSHTRLDMWACALAIWNNRKIKHIYNLYMNATPKKDFVHKWLFSKVDALCSSSETILNDVKKNFPIAPSKLHLIRYGRNVELFKPYPKEREGLRGLYQAAPDQIVIGTLCRIDPGKGVKELVQALESLSDSELKRIQLWIIGDPTIAGKDEQGQPIFAEPSRVLLEWIQEQQRNPRYRNHLVRIPFQKDYIPYIEALDVFALASYNETYSLSVLDAMMMAKPVIGTNAGGTPEQVGENERGVLAQPQSPSSLTEAFRYYLNNPGAIKVQGLKARQWSVQNHEWKETLEKFLALYSRLK